MPRRRVVAKREVIPDPKYGNTTLAKFMNHVMISGKKSVAESIVYGAMTLVAERSNRDPIEVFDEALENIAPMVEVKSRRVGGATYQVPVEISFERQQALAFRWMVNAARSRKGVPMNEALADEIVDAYNNTGGVVKKKEEVHRMAQANRAFAHLRW